MDLIEAFEKNSKMEPIKCIEMHTTGEPTRVVCSGFPPLQGTLLEQRAQAKEKYDHIRSRIILEPRGHWDMYGAILRQETELVSSGEAHIGVLFMHNHGFSTMCGHATIALGRFLVDTHDLNLFPRRNELQFDPVSKTTEVRLHAPCGLIRISVPTTPDGKSTDTLRLTSFVSTPAFATAIGMTVSIPQAVRWPELGQRTHITLDLSFGGTFYMLVSAQELGFPNGLKDVNLDAMGNCIRYLLDYLRSAPEVAAAITYPSQKDLSFLYSVMVVDADLGVPASDAAGAESGLCYFADQQIDRSPTGGCVVARMALAHAKGVRPVGQRWTYHSVVSNAFGGVGAFTGEVVEELKIEGVKGIAENGVRVKVEGQAYYTGSQTFIVEEADSISAKGFSMKSVASQ
ncbi:MAG: Trans-L-3-hydroxyproline dehydratase [Cirrosporium novae-zelandiae]|nr:MAG: Trans-L-3-hydroxyproline dehydratase [Cirrosporium novae-zelandiae]